MKRLLYLAFLSFSISQNLNSENNYISKLIMEVENASRSGQVVWAEEFSGLT
ncbi:MAG: hypothetical protein QF780_00990 [Candidatus Marinimicrobia bacterium]|nr:hypothetical protein [Candidatus Neomarinimicrobiota bacterium]